jgi:protease-4
MNGKRWAALGIAAVLFIGSIFISFLSSLAFQGFGDWQEELFAMEEQVFTEKVVEQGIGNERIAVLDVSGVIQDTGDTAPIFQTTGYHHRQFLRMLEHAGEDDNVEGIVIRVNTPGGGVVESDEIHDKIVEIQENEEKPIYISMGSMAASGGYYISAPADQVFAHPATLTGSLGVIIQSMNYAELAEKVGIEWETIKSGPHKDILSPSRDITEQEREIMQSLVDNSYDQFVNVISTGRDIPEAVVRDIADGRIYDGQQALELQLVDSLGDFDDTVEALKKELGNSNISVIKYMPSMGFDSFFSMIAQKMLNPSDDLLGIKEMLNQTQAPQVKYLYTE